MMETIIKRILEFLPQTESSLCSGWSVDRRRGGGGRIQTDPAEVRGVPGRGLSLMSIHARVCTDGPAVILQKVRIRVCCLILGRHGRRIWNFYFGLDRVGCLSLSGHIWLIHPHTPVNKEIILLAYIFSSRTFVIRTLGYSSGKVFLRTDQGFTVPNKVCSLR